MNKRLEKNLHRLHLFFSTAVGRLELRCRKWAGRRAGQRAPRPIRSQEWWIILHRLLSFHYLAKVQNAMSPIRLSSLAISDSVNSRISTSKTFSKRWRHTSGWQLKQANHRAGEVANHSREGRGYLKYEKATNLRFTGVKVKPNNSALWQKINKASPTHREEGEQTDFLT